MQLRGARKHIEQIEEVDSEGSWAISYGDMITLLLSFFIIFFTIDPQASNQNIKLKIAMIDSLNQQSQVETSVDSIMNLGKKKEDGIDPQVLKLWNGLAHDQGSHVIVEFPGISFFRSGEIEITKEGMKALTDFVKVYMPYAGNYFVSIRAFADRRAVRGTNHRYKDNLELTALRSIATMRIFQKAGIPLSRIRVGGYGELVMTAKEMEKLPGGARQPAAELDLARKVILVIEPEVLK